MKDRNSLSCKNARRSRRLWLGALCSSALLLPGPLAARDSAADTDPLAGLGDVDALEIPDVDLSGVDVGFADMNIEQLMDIEITSVSKKAEKLSATAAAIHVVTSDDIRRAGASTLVEALRLVPGVATAQINIGTTALSVRGFNSRFANKLLVLVDGRSIYTPLFSGVYWEIQDTLMEDINRIEVIRGPGGAVWGANAVNGVINIVTKSAKDTQGTFVSVTGGTEEQGTGSIRYGSKINDQTFYRVFYKYFNRDRFKTNPGTPANDHWSAHRGGFRLDWEPSDVSSFSFGGEGYTTKSFSPIGDNSVQDFAGGHIRAQWNRTYSEDTSLSLTTYYDRTETSASSMVEFRNTYDLELRYQTVVAERHALNWGLQYRLTTDETFRVNGLLSMTPTESEDQVQSLFLQDQITLIEDKLSTTLGVKLEHNDYTGYEVQPSARVAWNPAENQTVWAAVSRAVRTPSRAEVTVRSVTPLAFPPGASTVIQGAPDLVSETLLAYELGYRFQPTSKMSVDIATYYNDYDNVAGTATTMAPPPVVATTTLNRANSGSTYGGEVSVAWQAAANWRLLANYSLLQMHISGGGVNASSPQQQFHIQSRLDLTPKIEFDTILSFVDGLPDHGVSDYLRLDARLGWKASDKLNVSVGAKSLFEPYRREFGAAFSTAPTESQRSFYAKLDYTF